MDRARTGTSRMPRLLSRAVVVLGGTVAATAAGWLICAASASASTLPVTTPITTGPITGTHDIPALALPAGVSDAFTSVGLPAGHAPTTVDLPALPASALPTSALSGPPAGDMAGVTGELRGAVSQLDGHVPVDRDVPATPPAGRPSTPLAAPVPTVRSAPAVDRGLTRPAAGGPTTVPAAANTARSVFAAVRSARRAVDAPAPVAFPTTPTPRVPSAPWSPVTVPAAPGGTGGVGAPGTGGIGLVDESGTFPLPGHDPVRVAAATVPPGRVTAGKQPGITPD